MQLNKKTKKNSFSSMALMIMLNINILTYGVFGIMQLAHLLKIIGVTNTDDLEIGRDKPKWYIRFKEGTSKKLIRISNVKKDRIEYINVWKENYTEVLNSDMYKKINFSLEGIFEFLINDKDSYPIEFRIDHSLFIGGFWPWQWAKYNPKIYGRGITLAPKSKKGNVRIFIDDDPNIRYQYVHKEGSKKDVSLHIDERHHLRLDLLTAIVHEFGHAYALVYFQVGEKDKLYEELAVLFENLFRISRKKMKGLRLYH